MKQESMRCIYCKSKNTKKIGKRKNKNQEVQRYKCTECNKTFTTGKIKYKTYPAKIILSAVSYYNLGHTQEESSRQIARQFKIKVPQKTISNWVKEYKDICTFLNLRSNAIKLFKPEQIIFKQTLNHIQPYTFKYHKAKLHLLFHSIKYNNQFHNIAHFYEPLKNYLEKINSKKFPHHIFTYNKPTEIISRPAEIAKDNNSINDNFNSTSVGGSANDSASGLDAEINNKIKNIDATSAMEQSNEQRASQIRFTHLKIKTISKNNFACQLAKLSVNLASSNKDRHKAIQDFVLTNDSTTIATEVPVYLTNWDAGYYRNQNGFLFPLSDYQTPITGHIDILQIRNDLIHILDYKPEAEKQNPIEQLTIYALALSRKLNLPLYYFKCAWFDENNYFEFFPLHAVYDKKGPKIERFK